MRDAISKKREGDGAAAREGDGYACGHEGSGYAAGREGWDLCSKEGWDD